MPIGFPELMSGLISYCAGVSCLLFSTWRQPHAQFGTSIEEMFRRPLKTRSDRDINITSLESGQSKHPISCRFRSPIVTMVSGIWFDNWLQLL
jgi:hypothetical protein